MDRRLARELLGLAGDCADAEVKRRYATLSRVLKRRIVQAHSVAEKVRRQRALRNLVQVRDVALGRGPGQGERPRRRILIEDDWTPRSGVPGGIKTRDAALEFFGLAPEATFEAVAEIFHLRSRALKLVIARAGTDDELTAGQHALGRLNEIFHVVEEAFDRAGWTVVLDDDDGNRAVSERVDRLETASEVHLRSGDARDARNPEHPLSEIEIPDDVFRFE